MQIEKSNREKLLHVYMITKQEYLFQGISYWNYTIPGIPNKNLMGV